MYTFPLPINNDLPLNIYFIPVIHALAFESISLRKNTVTPEMFFPQIDLVVFMSRLGWPQRIAPSWHVSVVSVMAPFMSSLALSLRYVHQLPFNDYVCMYTFRNQMI